MWVDHSVQRTKRGGVMYIIDPCPAPRQVRSDKWKPRPMVVRYRAFRDHVRLLSIWVANGAEIIFYVKMPKSWSEKKKKERVGKPHKQTPDLDNYLKALLDAVFESDSHIWDIKLKKVWAYVGAIEIRNPK